MKLFFSDDVAGQSMRSGSATSLAENGVPPNLIQAIGRWASSAFQIYIRKNPVLLQALHFGRAAHDPLFNFFFSFLFFSSTSVSHINNNSCYFIL